MLASLIGNKSIEKILFFLLLNGKAYATQLSQRFEAPLTPLQHSLQKLEKNGILLSHYEGKTRFYTFNPSYPLSVELETLLKKAYTLLPIPDKKLYYSPSFSTRPQSRKKPFNSSIALQTVQKLWEKLGKTQTMCFSAKSKALGHNTAGWNGIGRGSVDVKLENEETLLFYERGSWTSEDSKELDFSNVFRWTCQPSKEAISLEHLRFGAQNPVFLFSLVPVDEFTLESIDSHVCNNDSYFGQIRCDKHFVQFHWRIIGPKKNEEIDYLYT